MAAVPVGFLATALLVVNNLRDIETDMGAGKKTLAVRSGRRGDPAAFTPLWWSGRFVLVRRHRLLSARLP